MLLGKLGKDGPTRHCSVRVQILQDDRGRRTLRLEGWPITEGKLVIVEKQAQIIRSRDRAVRVINNLGQRNARGVEKIIGHQADTIATGQRGINGTNPVGNELPTFVSHTSVHGMQCSCDPPVLLLRYVTLRHWGP